MQCHSYTSRLIPDIVPILPATYRSLISGHASARETAAVTGLLHYPMSIVHGLHAPLCKTAPHGGALLVFSIYHTTIEARRNRGSVYETRAETASHQQPATQLPRLSNHSGSVEQTILARYVDAVNTLSTAAGVSSVLRFLVPRRILQMSQQPTIHKHHRTKIRTLSEALCGNTLPPPH